MNASLPSPIIAFIQANSLVPFTIGESSAKVFQVTLRNSSKAFLKISSSEYASAEMRQEISVLHWLEKKLKVPKSIFFMEEDGTTYSLTSAILGQSLHEERKTKTAQECMRIGARYLRKIHSIPISNCPFSRPLQITLKLAEENVKRGVVNEKDFDSTRKGSTAKKVYETLLQKMPKEKEDLVFTHGDYCFPNIIVKTGAVSGVVDLGRAGVADRHQDIAIFLRSFKANIGSQPSIALFLQDYALVKALDEAKLEFYSMLDEFF